ncbi:uncharacterized protein KY384_008776 [Bacidia gigantensis]|uniref:uncharacterized protein n=1 Tax=Bacidia gigantensis TaxID=2732470 RepID=UPI001D03B53E|nr:uncharacterized protein KY384_008776 [Bacidia gigantensis]KAG8526575.1 hypothetical protein KY384_008776 [Bacidia gigantensis]
MYYKPNRHLDVPSTDLLTWIFGNEDIHDTDRPIYYPLIFLAVIGAGAIFVGSNPGYKELELTSLLETSKPNLIITAPDLLPAIQSVAKICHISTSKILTFAEQDETPKGFRSWTDLFKFGEQDWIRFDDLHTAKSTPACLVTTSGTTGMPKLAVLSHHAWVALNCVIDDPVPKPYDIKRLVFLPMFHTFAAPLSHLAPLREGHATYVMPRFSMSQFVDAVERFKINEIMVVPPMIVNFVSSTSPKAYLKNVRFVWCGGAPLDGAIMKKMYRLLAPNACIAQVYGMTEAGWISTSNFFPERDDSGSVGKLLPNVEAKLINSRGIFVQEAGKRGEICVRGPRLMNGYLGNAKASADSFIDGWLKTGDVGTVDKYGKIFIVDRQKAMRGWQVSPAELEGILRCHPQVADAAVIGVQHDNSEAPKALIVRNTESLTEEDVKAYIAALLVRYKHLDGGVSFVESIPKSPSGKILRKLL